MPGIVFGTEYSTAARQFFTVGTAAGAVQLFQENFQLCPFHPNLMTLVHTLHDAVSGQNDQKFRKQNIANKICI